MSQAYKVSVTFDDDGDDDGDGDKMAASFVPSVGLYIDGISQGFHSSTG